jgi:hypothetical protein
MADMGRHSRSFGVVSAAPFGSSAILPISWAYIKVRFILLEKCDKNDSANKLLKFILLENVTNMTANKL